MIKIIIISFLLFSVLKAENCEDTLFTFDVSEQNLNVKIVDIVENMAQKCKFSVKIKDKITAELLKKELFLVHIEDYTLDDMFEFLFSQNNIFYRFDAQKQMLNISFSETKSFVVDYINLSKHTTSSSKNILVGSSTMGGPMGGMMGGMGGMGGMMGGGMMGGGMMGGGMMGGGMGGMGGMGGGMMGMMGAENNSDRTIVNSETEFKFWNNIKSEIEEILAMENEASIANNITVNIETGVITVTGNFRQMKMVGDYTKKLMSRLHKQVMLEVKLFEVKYDDSTNIGIDWSVFTNASVNVGASMGYDKSGLTIESNEGTSASFNANFKMGDLIGFLDTYGDVNVISTPKIMTLNNQPAVINVGNQYNYQFVANRTTDAVGRESFGTQNGSSFIGLTLNILPEITEDGYVVLRMNPVVSDIIEKFSDRAPDIQIKQLSSIIKAKNGVHVVSGGLVSYTTSNKSNSVVGLGSLPIFEYLFKNEQEQIIKKELIIVVTPTIIDYDNYPSIDNIENLLGNSNDE